MYFLHLPIHVHYFIMILLLARYTPASSILRIKENKAFLFSLFTAGPEDQLHLLH